MRYFEPRNVFGENNRIVTLNQSLLQHVAHIRLHKIDVKYWIIHLYKTILFAVTVSLNLKLLYFVMSSILKGHCTMLNVKLIS